MSHRLNFSESVVPTLCRGRVFDDKPMLNGSFKIEQFRKGKLIATRTIENAVTNAAKNQLLNTFFGSTAKISGWAIGLINNTGFSALSAADTTASHSGWSEFTAYSYNGDLNVRAPWAFGTSTAQLLTNGTAPTFLFTATGIVEGIFIHSSNVQLTSTGLLWSTALFTSPLSVETSDELKITYTLAL